MKIGAGIVAARKFGASELVDPRPFAVGKLAETFEIYPNIGVLLPAMGYGDEHTRQAFRRQSYIFLLLSMLLYSV